MSEARDWADRMRETRPSLTLIGEGIDNGPSLWASVTEIATCEVTVSDGSTWNTVLIPHDLAGILGKFLVRTFSEPSELIHGRLHDAKMAEDHE